MENDSENPAPQKRRSKRQIFGVQPRPIGKPVREINGHDIEEASTVLPPDFTEDEIADRFSERLAPSLRYVADWGRWMLWDGKIWRKDNTLRAYDLARRHCRAMTAETQDPKVRALLASARMIAAIEKMARADRRQATTADQWDGNPWLLNTPGGIVDLKEGTISDHKPSWHMTKTTAVSPNADMPCPQWLAFLARVTGGNQQLVDYLQRIAGYWLTGMTREHAMWFFYGTGRNGKGTFLNIIGKILGDYAMVASPDTFTEAGSGKHLTVLARLQGARLVVSQETEEGIPWAEARIKSVTGGDPITANHMRQDPFTYVPQFKLAISGNHKPGLTSVDQAIRARFNLVPFTVTIPVGERDPTLDEKLWHEAPAILWWAVQGCLDWQKDRLNAPAIVSEATAEYFDSEDAVSLWIADCCVKKADELSGVLFKSWMSWAIKAGEKPGSHKAFGRMMEKQGFKSGKRNKKGVPIEGLRLRIPEDDMEYQPVENPSYDNEIPDYV